MVPALVAMGVGRHRANATSLAAIFVVALAGGWAFATAGSVDFVLGLGVGVGGVVGATIGAKWASRVSANTLARIFAVVLLVAGFRMLFSIEPSGLGQSGSAPAFAIAGGSDWQQDCSQASPVLEVGSSLSRPWFSSRGSTSTRRKAHRCSPSSSQRLRKRGSTTLRATSSGSKWFCWPLEVC